MPLGERQSNNRAELRAVLKALQQKQPEERLLVVLDAEIVYKGWGRRDQWDTLIFGSKYTLWSLRHSVFSVSAITCEH